MKVRKLLAVLLAVALLFGTTAFASSSTDDANTGSISIENYDEEWAPVPEDGHKYVAYKIFDVQYADNTNTASGYVYTIKTTSPWYATVTNYFDCVASTTDATVMIVTPKTGFSAAKFAASLNAVTNKPSDGVELVDGKATGLALGYYFVTTTTGSLCNLTTTDPDAEIYDKNAPADKTQSKDGQNYADAPIASEVGKEVYYKVETALPKVELEAKESFAKLEFSVSDVMTDGLTYQYISSIKIGGLTIDSELNAETIAAKAASYYPDLTADDLAKKIAEITGTITYKHAGLEATEGYTANGFELTINLKGSDFWNQFLGQPVVIDYVAVVNEKAVTRDLENNTVTVKYNHNPNNGSDYKTITDETELYSANIDIFKVDAADEKTPLAGAKFVLSNEDKTAFYLWTDDVEDNVSWTELPEGKTIYEAYKTSGFCTIRTTGTSGKLDYTFDGLDAGTYYLYEVEAPEGYKLPADPFEVTIELVENEDASTDEPAYEVVVTVDTVEAEMDDSDWTGTATIGNTSGSKLPETGGIGTTIFYVVGSVLLLGAVVLFVTKKRMSVN